MTREEAFTILNLPESSSTEAIQVQYDELYSDFRIRLTNAPTPNLKKLYQKNLQDLEEARNFLLSSTGVQNKDFPSASPVYEMQSKSTQQLNIPQNTAGDKSTPRKQKAGNYSIFWIIMTLTVTGIAGYLGMLWVDTMEKLAKTEILLKPLTNNGKFKIKNTGDSSFQVIAYKVVFWDDSKRAFVNYGGQLKSEIKAGSTVNFEDTEITNGKWKGDVIYYSIIADDPNRSGLISGIWANDAKNGVLEINLKTIK